MDGAYFDIEELCLQCEELRFYSEHFHCRLMQRVNRLTDMCGRLPEDDEIFFIETQKSFSAFAFVAYVLQFAGRIDELYIATYSTNERIINAILRWKDRGMIGNVAIRISETIKFRMPQVWKRLQQLHDEGAISLSVEWSHKKVACMKTPLGCYVVEGSGNYGENSLSEQYVFLRSEEVYLFRKKQDYG